MSVLLTDKNVCPTDRQECLSYFRCLRAWRKPRARAARILKLPLESSLRMKTRAPNPTTQGIVTQWYQRAYRLKNIRLCSSFSWVLNGVSPPPLDEETLCHSFPSGT